MPFLRNAWYVAGWSERLTDSPIRLKIMNEGIALYRLSGGGAVAIGDRCPHRFASLGDGKVVGDTLQCPYHGLRFDRAGRCVHNPHGEGVIPPGAKVNAYPLEERHHALWIWMGDPALADPELIPDYSMYDGPALASSRDYLRVPADYQLVIDNLLDLSHAAYIHPFLTTPGFAERTRTEVRQSDAALWCYMWNDDEPVTPLFKLVWESEAGRGDFRAHMRWSAPSNLFLDVGMKYPGTEDGPWLPSAHLLTPETETSTHYFWMIGRNCQHENAELGRAFHEGVAAAFTTEDEPMIVRVAENMAGEDFWSLRPAILAGDAAAVRARRTLSKLIREEGAPVLAAAE